MLKVPFSELLVVLLSFLSETLFSVCEVRTDVALDLTSPRRAKYRAPEKDTKNTKNIAPNWMMSRSMTW